MDYGPTFGLSTAGRTADSTARTAVGAWCPALYYSSAPVPVQPLAYLSSQQPGQQHQQPYYNPYIPVLHPVVAAPAQLPVINATSNIALAQQQPHPDVALGGPVVQNPLQRLPHQQWQGQSDAAGSEDDHALFDMLDDFEQRQRGNAQQQGRPHPSDTDGIVGSFCTQQHMTQQLGQQSHQQSFPAVTGQATVQSMAAYPYQALYGNQRYSTTVTQQPQEALNYQAYGYQPYHPGVAIGYNYGTYVPQHLPQQIDPFQHQDHHHHQPHQHPPWATSWAAGVQKRHGEAPPGFASSEGSRPCSTEKVGTAEATFRAGRQAEQSGIGSTLGVLAGLHDTSFTSGKGQKHRKHKPHVPGAAAAGRLPRYQESSPASKGSPHEQYFRRHTGYVDPFWASATSDDTGILAVTHLPSSSSVGDAVAVVQDTSFDVVLTSAQLTMIRSRTAVLQLLCLLIDDKFPHRCHWPCSATVCVNGQLVRNLYAAKRLPHSGLKPQQVDTPADIGSYAAARTTVKLTYTSSSSGYGMGVRLVRRQSVERVKQMVAKPPSLVAAVAGVKQKLAGDGDVEVSVNAVSLRCPLTTMRMKTPAHFITAPGLAYFDLEAFLELTQRSGKWQDPHSSALGDVSQLAVEPWLQAIIKLLEGAQLLDAVDEVEVNPDGCWRPKGAASDTWHDILQPPSHAQLREAYKGPAGGGIKRKRTADSGEAADEQHLLQQPRGAAATAAATAGGAKAQAGCVDLTLDSDDDNAVVAGVATQERGIRRPDAAAASIPVRRSSGSSAGALRQDPDFATFCEDVFGEHYGCSGRQQSAGRAGGSGTSAAAAGGTAATGSPTGGVLTRRQSQQQQGRAAVNPAAARASAAAEVIFIDSDSD